MIMLSSEDSSLIFLLRFDEWKAAGMKVPTSRNHEIPAKSQISIEATDTYLILTIQDLREKN